MESSINNIYTNEDRLKFAEEIFNSVLPMEWPHQYQDRLKKILQYWAVFVPFPPRSISAAEGEISYIESLYDQMRPFVFEWVTNFRMEGLIKEVREAMTRIEALENPNGGRLSDYR